MILGKSVLNRRATMHDKNNLQRIFSPVRNKAEAIGSQSKEVKFPYIIDCLKN
jgi:hypothetical protein